MNNISLNDYHIFICQNQRPSDSPKGCCMSKGSDKLLEHFKKLVGNLKVNIYSDAPVNWNVKQGVSEHSVDKPREHANSPQFCEANSQKHSSIQVTKSGCLNKCAQGVALVIYPSGTWYSIKSLTDVEEIVTSHLQGHQIVNRLLMKI